MVSIMFFVSIKSYAERFALIASSCNLTSSSDDDPQIIKHTDATLTVTVCDFNKTFTSADCKYYNKTDGPEKPKQLGEDNYESLKIGDSIILSKDSLKIVLNTKSKTFSQGQTNIIIENSAIINKLCVGESFSQIDPKFHSKDAKKKK